MKVWLSVKIGDDVRIILFVVNKKIGLNEEDRELIRQSIRKNCSPKHAPHKIIEVEEIPRTKSGKIVELAVKKAINGEKINNLQALSNPDSINFFKKIYKTKLLMNNDYNIKDILSAVDTLLDDLVKNI